MVRASDGGYYASPERDGLEILARKEDPRKIEKVSNVDKSKIFQKITRSSEKQP